jgi:hypothetical protein
VAGTTSYPTYERVGDWVFSKKLVLSIIMFVCLWLYLCCNPCATNWYLSNSTTEKYIDGDSIILRDSYTFNEKVKSVSPFPLYSRSLGVVLTPVDNGRLPIRFRDYQFRVSSILQPLQPRSNCVLDSCSWPAVDMFYIYKIAGSESIFRASSRILGMASPWSTSCKMLVLVLLR